MIKTRKRSKRTRERGSRTCYWGGRKKHKGTGMRGGAGMSGTGKKSGQKITWVQKNFGNDYFGGEGLKRKSEKLKEINLRDIMLNIDKYEGKEINLEGYKILGEGDFKGKLIIKAERASKSAKEKIEKAGGKLILKDFERDYTGKFKEKKEEVKEEKKEVKKEKAEKK